LFISLVGFNLGVETMQLVVVAATMPSLVLLGRTRAYSLFRTGGAIFCLAVSGGWIVERLLNLQSAVDPLMERFARYGPWIAVTLFLVSVISWLYRTLPVQAVRFGLRS
jgi:hypothetical protein